jgi:hypothetical protein
VIPGRSDCDPRPRARGTPGGALAECLPLCQDQSVIGLRPSHALRAVYLPSARGPVAQSPCSRASL